MQCITQVISNLVHFKVYPTLSSDELVQCITQGISDLLSDKMVHFEVYLTLSSDKIGASENIYPSLSTQELPFLMTSEGPAKSDTI